jgi:hypothetical protein
VRLEVKGLEPEDCWRDIVRIKKHYRIDRSGRPIARGRICIIKTGDREAWVVMHGRETDECVIQIDLNLRRILGVRKDQVHDFEITQLSWLRALWYPWKASDPGYRISGQLGLIGLFLGLVGILLGVVALFH